MQSEHRAAGGRSARPPHHRRKRAIARPAGSRVGEPPVDDRVGAAQVAVGVHRISAPPPAGGLQRGTSSHEPGKRTTPNRMTRESSPRSGGCEQLRHIEIPLLRSSTSSSTNRPTARCSHPASRSRHRALDGLPCWSRIPLRPYQDPALKPLSAPARPRTLAASRSYAVTYRSRVRPESSGWRRGGAFPPLPEPIAHVAVERGCPRPSRLVAGQNRRSRRATSSPAPLRSREPNSTSCRGMTRARARSGRSRRRRPATVAHLSSSSRPRSALGLLKSIASSGRRRPGDWRVSGSGACPDSPGLGRVRPDTCGAL